MANSPVEFLAVDEQIPHRRHQRSRSSDYVDDLEEQAQWDRRDRERQMKLYRRNNRQTSTTHHRTNSDHLCVPIFEEHRAPRSSERAEQRRNESPHSFRVEEVRPGPRPLGDYDLNTAPALPTQLPVKYEWKPQLQSKPKIKVQIVQDTPPSNRQSVRTPKRSPSASPKSPTARPELQFQYSTLQAKLAQIGTTCQRFENVLPANPRDLTFEKIAAQADGFAVELQIWSEVANLDGLAMVEKSKRNIADAAARTLGRMIERVSDLHDACATAKPRDLKFSPLPKVDDDEGEYGPYNADNGASGVDDPIETPGFVIHSLLRGIEVQIQTLKRLTRSMQEATPAARDEVVSVSKLVEEAAQYFGSDAALKRHSIDLRFAGRKALDEVRYMDGAV